MLIKCFIAMCLYNIPFAKSNTYADILVVSPGHAYENLGLAGERKVKRHRGIVRLADVTALVVVDIPEETK